MPKKNIRTISYILAPIVSSFLFVTIITANPTIVTGDLNTKEIITVNAVLTEVATSIPEIITPDNTEALATAPTLSPEIPKSVQTPAPKKPTQPTRSSSSPSTSTSTDKPTNTTTNTPTSTPVPPKTTSSSGNANAIITTSKQYIGVNYLYGGTTPAGFDCSGYTQYVFAKHNINLPRVSRDQYKVGTSVSYSNLQAGDLVFFSFAKNGVVDHVGIHVGNGQFINASSSKGVTIYTLGPYWQSVYIGAKRVI